MNKMIVANLVHRPVRSLISVFAIAVEVTLILVIVGLSLGMLSDSTNRTVGVGGDILVQPSASSFLMGLSSAPVSTKYADVIAKLPHVQAIAPVLLQTNTDHAIEVIYGIDLNSFNRLRNPFVFIEGGPFTGPDQVLVDDYWAAQNNIHVGDTTELLNHKVKVAGIVAHGKGARKFLPLSTLQNWQESQGKASMFYVRADDPKNADLIAQEIRNAGMQNFTVRSMNDLLSMTSGSLPGFRIYISVVIGVAVVIGFIVIFQGMYTAVMERTREIGILKSLGASKLYIVGTILRETALLAVVDFLLPNLFFHCTTTYAILRESGVPIGKLDFIGATG
jgi:putative ABC transport system permease protein